jgi:rRNA processing protein Krr1/Pno1
MWEATKTKKATPYALRVLGDEVTCDVIKISGLAASTLNSKP